MINKSYYVLSSYFTADPQRVRSKLDILQLIFGRIDSKVTRFDLIILASIENFKNRKLIKEECT